LRGAAGALLQGWSLEAPGPQNELLSAAQRCSPQYVEIDRPIFVGHLAIIQAQSNVLGFGRLNPTEGTPMEKKWRVSHVELLEGGLLFGFVLYDEKGRPCVSFGYADDKKANVGRNQVAAALKDAEQVLGR
jgi:hypothetical protein